MNSWLMSWSNEDIQLAMDAVWDQQVRCELEISNPVLLILCVDSKLMEQACHLAKHDFDRVAAALAWENR
jgi:hypothetical protein